MFDVMGWCRGNPRFDAFMQIGSRRGALLVDGEEMTVAAMFVGDDGVAMFVGDDGVFVGDDGVAMFVGDVVLF